MVILLAGASTSIVLAAFSRLTHRPDYHKRHHVYCDDDGEALPAEHQENQDRTTRILIALSALGAFLLSVWDWAVHEHDSTLAVITIAWVCCQYSYSLTSLIASADNSCFELLLPCCTIVTEATTLR